jgi:2-iminobutanoate/2-iminopropanoate deaminase
MRTPIATTAAPTAIGPYSQAIRHGDVLYCSGQVGIDPATGAFAGPDTISQTRQCLANLDAVCRAAGTRLSAALHCTVFLIDLGEFTAVNEAYAQHVETPFPARATVQVSALPRGARVEISAIVAC